MTDPTKPTPPADPTRGIAEARETISLETKQYKRWAIRLDNGDFAWGAWFAAPALFARRLDAVQFQRAIRAESGQGVGQIVRVQVTIEEDRR